MRELEVYIHIPFCVKKCAYCDFLSAPASEQEREEYLQALLAEIQGGMPSAARFFLEERDGREQAGAAYRMTDDYLVTSVFIGGGTPSLLSAEQIARILEALRARFLFADTAEITIECNPGTVDPGKLKLYRAGGVNRISFGLQSSDNEELQKLGRIHTWETFLQSYESARAAGFSNINLDLMSALPGQTVSSWERTLREVLSLAPEHISAYSLIIEEGTPFYEMYHEDDVLRAAGKKPRYLPSEEEERTMYLLTEELLGNAGLRRYEISNYARAACECRHNIGYWRGTDYMGFGLGASSLLCFSVPDQARPVSVRMKNPSAHAAYALLTQRDTASYREGSLPRSALDSGMEAEILSIRDEMEEFMFLGLRMISGVSERDFRQRFGCPIDQIYGAVLDYFVALGLLARENDRIALTPRGLDVSNTVMAEFLLE